VNPYAAAIADSVRARVSSIQARLVKEGGAGVLPDSVVLKLLRFMRRAEVLQNNGRRRSRAFLDMLNRSYVPMLAEEAAEAAETPRIIL
jgi:hypothetical protein